MRVIGFTLLLALLTACGTPTTATTTTPASAPSPTPEGGEQQQHEAGSVTASASWIAGEPAAQIGMNTHSVDLDGFDLKELARVRLDGGEWIRPTLWEAPKGGHHRGGTLTFGTLDPNVLASSRLIELEIRDAPVTHLLRWQRE
jgi:hypothetical protein